MGRKITMNGQSGQSVAETYQNFIFAKTAEGVSDVTIRNYHQHLHNISKYLNAEKPMASLTKKDLENMICEMRKAGLAHNSVSTYVRVLRSFLNWCQKEGRTNISLPNMEDKETVKETYTDDELVLLLQKPAANGSFPEYRNWAIVNFLLNSGCRAATVRNIQNRDVDLCARQVVYRHTKNGKNQSVPLCSKIFYHLLTSISKWRGVFTPLHHFDTYPRIFAGIPAFLQRQAQGTVSSPFFQTSQPIQWYCCDHCFWFFEFLLDAES